jgi:hypothetical protein
MQPPPPPPPVHAPVTAALFNYPAPLAAPDQLIKSEPSAVIAALQHAKQVEEQTERMHTQMQEQQEQLKAQQERTKQTQREQHAEQMKHEQQLEQQLKLEAAVAQRASANVAYPARMLERTAATEPDVHLEARVAEDRPGDSPVIAPVIAGPRPPRLEIPPPSDDDRNVNMGGEPSTKGRVAAKLPRVAASEKEKNLAASRIGAWARGVQARRAGLEYSILFAPGSMGLIINKLVIEVGSRIHVQQLIQIYTITYCCLPLSALGS